MNEMQLEYKFNKTLCDLDIKMKKSKDGLYFVNATMLNSVDFTKVSVCSCNIIWTLIEISLHDFLQLFGSLSSKSNRDSENYENILFHNQINMCKFIQRNFNFMVEMMLNIQKRYANFSFHCPLPKGNYTFTNFPIDATFFPSITPEIQFRIYLALSAQLVGMRSMREIYNVSVTGELIRR